MEKQIKRILKASNTRCTTQLSHLKCMPQGLMMLLKQFYVKILVNCSSAVLVLAAQIRKKSYHSIENKNLFNVFSLLIKQVTAKKKMKKIKRRYVQVIFEILMIIYTYSLGLYFDRFSLNTASCQKTKSKESVWTSFKSELKDLKQNLSKH